MKIPRPVVSLPGEFLRARLSSPLRQAMSDRFEHHHDLSSPPSAVRWDLGEKPAPVQTREKVCAIRLGLRVLGIPERFVRGLREIESVTPVPGTPPHVLGVTALDGAIVPLLDIAELLGARASQATPPCAGLLVEAAGFAVLIAVEEVVAFERLDDEPHDQDLHDQDSYGEETATAEPPLPWTTGRAPILGRPIPLLDLPELLKRLRPTFQQPWARIRGEAAEKEAAPERARPEENP